MTAGTMYQNLLREIASHGFILVANGALATGLAFLLGVSAQTKMTQMTESLD